ncbi:MAG: hypothetical protein M1818_007895 [Claussenomyces sp. TS43310]|nr:MAG: hypothetical protein M1818_007895 [Claussenomyces sp. TS43310]
MPSSTGSCDDLERREVNSALLRRSLALQTVYLANLSGDLGQLHAVCAKAARKDIDTACALLMQFEYLWGVNGVAAQNIPSMIRMYATILDATQSSDLRSLALQGAAYTLDRLPDPWEDEHFAAVKQLQRHILPVHGIGGPELSNAEIRISGCILLYCFNIAIQQDSFGDFHEQVKCWGVMLGSAGKSENEFDARLSAAEALKSFYSRFPIARITSFPHPSLLPSLVALYDALNDDDDDIRDLGADVVFYFIGNRLEPLAAKSQYLVWLSRTFGGIDAFHKLVLTRIKEQEGRSRPIEEELREAMVEDDSLFVEEEHNLYLDRVRESEAWNSLITHEEGHSWTTTALELSSWTIEGLATLRRFSKFGDDSFGKLSKPQVFAIYMGVVQSTRALLTRFHKILEEGKADCGAPLLSTNGMAQSIVSDYRIGGALEKLEVESKLFLETASQMAIHPFVLDCMQKHKTCYV